MGVILAVNSHGTEDGVDWRGAEGKDLKPIQFRWWEETKLPPQSISLLISARFGIDYD